MEVTGKIKLIRETKTYGEKGFRKREVIVTTDEQYPQELQLEFVQDKCDLLDSYNVGNDVKISINLRGREWINPQGEAVYFNTIQGWRIEKVDGESSESLPEVGNDLKEEDPNDLPF